MDSHGFIPPRGWHYALLSNADGHNQPAMNTHPWPPNPKECRLTMNGADHE